MLGVLTSLLLLAAPPAEKPAAAVSERPSASKAPKALESDTPAAQAPPPFVDSVTKVDGKWVQVVLGARAVLHLDDGGAPILDKAETGQLAAAHPAGAVKEAFETPEKGRLAFALDGSAEKRGSYLKVWNELDYPVSYRAIAVVLRTGGKGAPMPVRTCAVAAGKTDLVTWPHPVIAMAITDVRKAADDKACR